MSRNKREGRFTTAAQWLRDDSPNPKGRIQWQRPAWNRKERKRLKLWSRSEEGQRATVMSWESRAT
jgi:hypothetical protein